MSHYVVGDVHGCYDDFISLIEYIENNDSTASFILLGDIIDRGPNVMKMLLWAMDNVTVDGKYQMVLGNHELEVIDWYHYHFLPWFNLTNTKYIMPSTYYDFSGVMGENRWLDINHLEPVITFFEERPLFINLDIKGELCFPVHIAHAWYPDRNCLPDLADEEYVWSRLHITKEFEDLERENAILIHGHTPTLSPDCIQNGAIPRKIWFKKKSINLDCGCCYKDFHGRLAALKLEDFTEYYCENGKIFIGKEKTPQRIELEDFLKKH